MIVCPNCRNSFTPPAGAAPPYACPACRQTTLGRYCGLEWIGAGAMGEVYRARQPDMGNREVALKVPKRSGPHVTARFEREIAASARLQHENIVRAFDRGELDGVSFLVMEFVDGRPFSELIAESHPLPTRRVARILAGVARGLAHAAERGVVNRDVKPENILLARPNETPKILDYGLARISELERGTTQVTRYGALLGTPGYLSPEQATDPHDVTIAADVYSLGCVAHFALTGQAPFSGASSSELARQHATSPRPSARTLRADVPVEFDQLIQRMMAILPAQRPRPEEVARELDRMLPQLDDAANPMPALPPGTMIEVACPHCNEVYRLRGEMLGQRMRCPNNDCRDFFTVEPLPEAIADAEPVEAIPLEAEALAAEPMDAVPLDAVPLDAVPLEAEPIAEIPAEHVVETLPAQAIVSQGGGGQRAPTAGGSLPTVDFVPELPAERFAPVDSDDGIETLPAAAIRRPASDSGVRLGDRATHGGASSETPVESEDIPELPAEFAHQRPAEYAPATSSYGAQPAAAPYAASRKKKRSRVALWVEIGLGVAATIAIIALGVALWGQAPDAEARWAEIQEQYRDKKWTRAKKEFGEFVVDFPDSPHVAEVPYFQDMCDAGADTYSETGNPAKGLKTAQEIFLKHRDNPAYKAYRTDLFLVVERLAKAFVTQAEQGFDLDKLAQAREAQSLMSTASESLEDDWVLKKKDDLAASIAAAETKIRTELARREIGDLLKQAASADAKVDVDAVYAKDAELSARYPALASDSELAKLRNEAFLAESARVKFIPAADGEGHAEPPSPTKEPGSSRFVVWQPAVAGGKPPREQIVMALARGVLYVFQADGTPLWARRLGVDSFRLPQVVEATDSSPALLVAVATEDNSVLALNAATGDILWKRRVEQDIYAPPLKVALPGIADGPPRVRGLLPTPGGEVRVLELARGRELGAFQVGQPMTVGGVFDPARKLAFFTAESRRVFAINPEAIDDPKAPACRSVLLDDHTSGAVRTEPVVVDKYYITTEADDLERMSVRAFELADQGFLTPKAAPQDELKLEGWSWFAPHATPDRFTLVTDRGVVGAFGLNLDNTQEAIYSLIDDPRSTRFSVPHENRTLVVHANENMLWVLAGGKLHKCGLDILNQQLRKSETPASLGGVPLHEAQVDARGDTFYVATMDAGGFDFQASAIDARRGELFWQRQLGINVSADPIALADRVVLIDETSRLAEVRVQDVAENRMVTPPAVQAGPRSKRGRSPWRLRNAAGEVHLALPTEDGKGLALCPLNGSTGAQPAWRTLPVPGGVHGRPAMVGDALVVPDSKGELFRAPLDGSAAPLAKQGLSIWFKGRPTEHDTGSVYRVDDRQVVVVENGRRVMLMELTTDATGLSYLKQIGSPWNGPTPLLEPLTVVEGRGIYVAEAAGTLHQLALDNPAKHVREWSLGGALKHAPERIGDRLIAVVGDRSVVCVACDAPADATTPTWSSAPMPRGRICGQPTFVGDTLLIADDRPSITGRRLSDGRQLWSLRLPAQAIPSAAAAPLGEGRLVAPLVDGTLYIADMPKPAPEVAEKSP